MKTFSRRVGEHVEDVVFRQFARRGLPMALSERMARRHRFIRIPCAKSLFALPMAGQAADTSKDERYETALNNMLADIADPQRSFEFVKAATDVGDQRGAVTALERETARETEHFGLPPQVR